MCVCVSVCLCGFKCVCVCMCVFVRVYVFLLSKPTIVCVCVYLCVCSNKILINGLIYVYVNIECFYVNRIRVSIFESCLVCINDYTAHYC